MSDPEHAPSYREVLAAVIRRFIRLVGEPAALRVARKVPGLVIADDGSILDYNEADPTGTLNLLIDGYEVVFGDIAVTLAKQAAATTDPELVDYIGPPPPLTARLLLVDDHVLFRNGLASVFNYQPDFKVVGQAGSVREGLALARELKPDLILMDFTLPDGTGLDALRAILVDQPAVKIVFLTVHDDDERLFAVLRAGALGFLPKNVRAADLLQRVRGVLRGEVGLLPVVAARILKEFASTPASTSASADQPTLTTREIEIVAELAQGSSNREIAHKFVISENTVKNHVRNVLSKLQLRNRREIINYARRHGLT